MDILVTADSNYIDEVSKMLYSLKRYHSDLVIHLVYDNLSSEALDRLKNFIDNYNIGVLKTYYFDSSKLNLFVIKTDYITTTCYLRLYAPYIIPDVERLLYLDPDIVCQANLDELYHMDMGDNIIAACPNMLKENVAFLKELVLRQLSLPLDTVYINSGVLLIDMQKYRDFISFDGITAFLKENMNILEYHDQDTINCIFHGKILILDNTYNYQINAVDWWNLKMNQHIIHYSESTKPWKDDYYDVFRARPYYQILYELGETEKLKQLIQSHSSNSVSMLYDEFSIK